MLRDRAFVHLAVADVAMIAIGWGVFTWLLPPFAHGEIGLGAPLIGLLLTANALTVVVAQVPVARFADEPVVADASVVGGDGGAGQ